MPSGDHALVYHRSSKWIRLTSCERAKTSHGDVTESTRSSWSACRTTRSTQYVFELVTQSLTRSDAIHW